MICLAVIILFFASAISGPVEEPHDDIKLRLYSADESYAVWSLWERGAVFSSEKYNTTLDLVIIILGYDENQNVMIQNTVAAMFSQNIHEKYNIVAVDLPESFSFNAKNLYFFRPASNVQAAGNALGDFINMAVDDGTISAMNVNVVAFSLGAQIAGYLGRRVNGIIQSISGVDPSGIGFDWSSLVTGLVHVSSDDARFVHLYHSNSAALGTQQRLATADYLFNTGETQPGCNILLDPFCSHLRGFAYYLEALRSSPGLPALQCNNYSHLNHCKCRGNRTSFVGFPPDFSAKGLFVLRTGESPPYSLGQSGTVGTKCKSEKSHFDLKMGRHYDAAMHMLGVDNNDM